MSEKNIKSFIEELIDEVEKELEEANVTGNVDGYDTPFAFSDKNSDKKRKKTATQFGYTLVNNDINNIDESINEDTKRVNILGIDFNISEMNGRIFFSFIDKKAASLKIREIGTNKIVNLIQKSLDNAYGKGEFFFKGGDHAEFQNGYLFQRNATNIKLNKLKFESVNEASLQKGKTYGGSKCEGGCFIGKQGLMKIIKISKESPKDVFMFRDDNYSGLQPHFIKDGVIAKATVINPAYDLEKHKVSNLKIGNDVILSVRLFVSTNESVNEGLKHLIHVETPKEIVSKDVAKQITALAKKGVRSYEIGLNMGFVGNQKAAVDSFQKVKNKIYFDLDTREGVNESLDPKAQKFLDAIQVNDRSIKDLKNITVDATPQGNWSVYYKGKRMFTLNGKMLDDKTIMKYGLEHMDESLSEGKKIQRPVNRWLELKNDESMHANKKLATGLRELKYQLKEVETFFRWYNQIKTMNELSSDGFWKRTHGHIYKIKERLINIAKTIQEIEK